MNAIQKAIELLKGNDDLYDHSELSREEVIPALEAMLNQEPVGYINTAYVPTLYRGIEMSPGDAIYPAPCPPCDLKALVEDAFDAGEDYGKALIITKDMPTVTDKPDLDAIIQKHTGGK